MYQTARKVEQNLNSIVAGYFTAIYGETMTPEHVSDMINDECLNMHMSELLGVITLRELITYCAENEYWAVSFAFVEYIRKIIVNKIGTDSANTEYKAEYNITAFLHSIKEEAQDNPISAAVKEFIFFLKEKPYPMYNVMLAFIVANFQLMTFTEHYLYVPLEQADMLYEMIHNVKSDEDYDAIAEFVKTKCIV